MLFSQVNAKNGNFSVSYTDVVIEDFYLLRTYNSAMVKTGLFGYGWGSSYDDMLVVLPDGTIAFLANGIRRIMFRPDHLDKEQVLRTVEAILEARQKQGRIESAEERQRLKTRLLNSEETRINYWRNILQLDWAPFPKLKTGTVLLSKCDQCMQDALRLEVLEQGYKIIISRTESKYFNQRGQMTRSIKNLGTEQEASANFHYDDDHHLQLITFGNGHYLKVRTNAIGYITQLKDQYGRRANYTYDLDTRNLLSSQDIGGTRHVHEYDKQHNMTAIKYEDGTQRIIEYENSLCTTLKFKDRSHWKFQYRDSANFEETYLYIGDGKNTIQKQYYSYLYDLDPLGTRYLKQLAHHRSSGDSIRLVLNSFPLTKQAQYNDWNIKYFYDDLNRLVRAVDSSGLEFRIDYDRGQDQPTFYCRGQQFQGLQNLKSRSGRFLLPSGDTIWQYHTNLVKEPKTLKQMALLDSILLMASFSINKFIHSGKVYSRIPLKRLLYHEAFLQQEDQPHALREMASYIVNTLVPVEEATVENPALYRRAWMEAASQLHEKCSSLEKDTFQWSITAPDACWTHLRAGQYQRVLEMVNKAASHGIQNKRLEQYKALAYVLSGQKQSAEAMLGQTEQRLELLKTLNSLDNSHLQSRAEGWEDMLIQVLDTKEKSFYYFDKVFPSVSEVLQGQPNEPCPDKLEKASHFLQKAYAEQPSAQILTRLIQLHSFQKKIYPFEYLTVLQDSAMLSTGAYYYYDLALDEQEQSKRQDYLLKAQQLYQKLHRVFADPQAALHLYDISKQLSSPDLDLLLKDDRFQNQVFYLTHFSQLLRRAAKPASSPLDTIFRKISESIWQKWQQQPSFRNDLTTADDYSKALSRIAHKTNMAYNTRLNAHKKLVEIFPQIYHLAPSETGAIRIISAFSRLASFMIRKKQHEEAYSYLDMALTQCNQLMPTYQESARFKNALTRVQIVSAATALYTNRWQKAEEHARLALELTSGKGFANTSLIRALLLTRQYDAALAHYEKVKYDELNSKESMADALLRQLSNMEEYGVFEADHAEVNRFRSFLEGE